MFIFLINGSQYFLIRGPIN